MGSTAVCLRPEKDIVHVHRPAVFLLLLLQIRIKGERTALLKLLLLLDELCIPCRRLECGVDLLRVRGW